MKKIKEVIEYFINWQPDMIWRIFILVYPFIILFIIGFSLDNDFWFLINVGKEIVNNGFITIDPFVIHSGFAFVPQQWLTDVIFYYIYNNFNIYGMIVLLNIANAIIIFLMYRLILLVSNNRYKLAILLTLFIDVAFVFLFLKTRPQIFDMIFILLEVYLLELYVRKKNKKYLCGLPIISLLMINLHASIWPMLFVILIPYYLGRINIKWFTKESYNLKPIIIVTIVMILCGFINPYGIDMITYFFKSYGLYEVNYLVGEMNNTTISNGLSAYIYIFVILFSYYVSKKANKNVNLRYLLLFLGTTYLALSHFKGLLFFTVVSILPIADNFKLAKVKEKQKEGINYITTSICAVLFIALIIYAVNNLRIEKEENNRLYDIANYLDNNASKDIKLYTNYNDGAYMEYRGYKCYIDPRAEVFYKVNNKKEDIMIEYYDLNTNILNPQIFLDKYNFDYLIVSNIDSLYYYLEYAGYIKAYEKTFDNGGYRLYKRNDL